MEMIKCHLSRLMGERRLHIGEVAEKAGLSPKTVSSIYHERAKGIDYETLDKLCRTLGVQVEDLLEFIP